MEDSMKLIEGDTRLFDTTNSRGFQLVVDVSRHGVGWIEIGSTVEGSVFCLTGTELRQLADALSPYQTQRVANDLVAEPVVHQADRFCHTCGTKTFENKPRNDAPTFLAPRHGHDGLGG
jgi:hypothetical protein